MKFSHILTGVWALSGPPYTGHSTEGKIRGNDTMQFYLPPPLVSTYRVWYKPLKWVLYLWYQSEEWGRQYHCSTIFETYSCLLPILKCGALNHRLSLVFVLYHMTPFKYGGASHCLVITQVCVQYETLKHPHECQQRTLNPYRISSCNGDILGIKHKVLIPHWPSQPMVWFLGETDLQKSGPLHCINHYVEDGGWYHKLDVTWFLCQFDFVVINHFKNTYPKLLTIFLGWKEKCATNNVICTKDGNLGWIIPPFFPRGLSLEIFSS